MPDLDLSQIRVLYGRGTEHLPIHPLHLHLVGDDGKELDTVTEATIRFTPSDVEVLRLERMTTDGNGRIIHDDDGQAVTETIPAESRTQRVERIERIVIALFALFMAGAFVAIGAERGFAGWGWMQSLYIAVLGSYGIGLLIVAKMDGGGR